MLIGTNTVVAQVQSHDDRFVVSGFVEGKNCKILLDSGAGATIVRKDLVTYKGLRPLKNTSLRVANNSFMKVVGKKFCRICIGGTASMVDCFVVEDLAHPCILGVDGLKTMRITMQFSVGSQKASSGDVPIDSVEGFDDVDCGIMEEKYARRLRTLLDQNKEIFEPVIPGSAEGIEHEIQLMDEVPIVCREKRVSLMDQKLIEEHVQQMLSDGVISHSKSPYRSSVVLATKKDGKKRFCVNYCRLNDRTVKNRHPLPFVDDLVDRTSGSKYFCVLDLSSAYWQIPLAKKDREKTAFSTGSGHYEFNVMPFGLCNAPATQQEFMRRTLRGFEKTDVLVDDIIIHGNDMEATLKSLEGVFAKLKEKNLRLNRKKCHFMKNCIKYLGFVISGEGRALDPDKTKAIESFPVPKSVSELKSFLGLTAYCKRFVKGFSTIAAPLYALTRKRCEWIWSKATQNSFEQIKAALMKPPVLAIPDVKLPYTLYTDASATGMGAVLCQTNGTNERVVCYASQHFNQREQKYSTIEKEAAAVIWAIAYFRPYLKGARFRILSDHAPLKWLVNRSDAEGRLGRWQMKLLECDGLDGIEYLRGTENSVADALSRIPEILVLNPGNEKVDAESLRLSQEEDSDFDERKFILNDNVWKFAGRIFIPKCLRDRLLESYHGNGVHLGVTRTTDLLRPHYYWSGMNESVSRKIQNCDFCSRAKNKPGVKLMPLSMPPTSRPFERISIDYAGPMKRTRKGNVYFLTVVDDFSRYLKIFPVSSANGETTIKCLKQVFMEEGVAEEVVSDNGTHFTSVAVEEFLSSHGVKHTRTPAYHPASNGMAERSVRTVKSLVMADLLERGGDWDMACQKIQLHYNSSVHASTGQPPFAVARGRTPSTSAAGWLGVRGVVEQFCDPWSKVVERSVGTKRKRNMDHGGLDVQDDMEIGERVWRWSVTNKKWMGPWTVEEKLGSVLYKLDNGTVVHRNHLRSQK